MTKRHSLFRTAQVCQQPGAGHWHGQVWGPGGCLRSGTTSTNSGGASSGAQAAHRKEVAGRHNSAAAGRRCCFRCTVTLAHTSPAPTLHTQHPRNRCRRHLPPPLLPRCRHLGPKPFAPAPAPARLPEACKACWRACLALQPAAALAAPSWCRTGGPPTRRTAAWRCAADDCPGRGSRRQVSPIPLLPTAVGEDRRCTGSTCALSPTGHPHRMYTACPPPTHTSANAGWAPCGSNMGSVTAASTVLPPRCVAVRRACLVGARAACMLRDVAAADQPSARH